MNSSATSTRFNLASPRLRLESCVFRGKGVLVLGNGTKFLKKADIASNMFDSGFTVTFGSVTRGALQMRNNVGMQYHTASARAVQCDARYGTGVAAGCDLRALCRDLSGESECGVSGLTPCGVQCSCIAPLSFKKRHVPDGSRCEFQGQQLQVFQENTEITATVRKPLNLHKNITVMAQSEQAFVSIIKTDAAFLRVDGKQHIERDYVMSTAVDMRYDHYTLTVLANKTNWSDTQLNHGLIMLNSS